MKRKLADVRRGAWLLLTLALASCATPAPPERPVAASVVRFEGLLEHPLVLRADDLATRPQQLQQAAFDSHEGPQSHRYQGVSLFELLQQAGIQAESKKTGGLLDRYLVASGKDGYQVVFSIGELASGVAGKGSLVATRLDAESGGQHVLYSTAPGDAKGGRYVANLASLDVRAPSPAIDISQVALGMLQIAGAINKPITLDAAALGSMPQSAQKIGNADVTGASLWTLLNQAGWQLDTRLKNPLLSMFVVAQGRDGYRVVFSVAELSPDFGNRPVLVTVSADQSSGAALVPPEFRLVVPHDADHSRWVRQLVSLTLESAKPADPAASTR